MQVGLEARLGRLGRITYLCKRYFPLTENVLFRIHIFHQKVLFFRGAQWLTDLKKIAHIVMIKEDEAG